MGLAQRLRRLEEAEEEREVLRRAQRMAEKYGLEPAEVLRRLYEIMGRVDRCGVDAELLRIAKEHGLSEAEVRASYQAALRECEEADDE